MASAAAIQSGAGLRAGASQISAPRNAARASIAHPQMMRQAPSLRSTQSAFSGSSKALRVSRPKESISTAAIPIAKVELPFSIGKKKDNKKTVILTGSSSGLGLNTMRTLMSMGDYHVICGVRDTEKMKVLAESEGFDPSSYTILPLELKSFESVREFVKLFRKTKRTLDVLCCNAAIYLPNQPEPTFGTEGYEESLTVNHLSHFLLANLMIPDLKKSKDPRCIIVGSITGNTNTVGGGAVKPFADLGNMSGLENKSVMVDGKDYDGAKAYKDAKLMNMMTSLELHRRFHDETGIVFNTMYPGCIVETALFRQKNAWFRNYFFPFLMKYITGGYVSMPEAGDRLAEVITSPKCNESGVYWSWNGGARTTGVYNPLKGEVQGAGGAGGELFKNMPSQEVRNERKGKKMWELSERAVGLKSKSYA